MVGSKPNVYLTEEARLEAQRRMLAERYGHLLEDLDDPDETDDTETTTKSTQSTSVNGETPSQNGELHNRSQAANGKSTASADSKSPDKPSSSDGSTTDRLSHYSYLKQSTDSPKESTSTNLPDNVSATKTSPRITPKQDGWPRADLVDRNNGNKILTEFDCSRIFESQLPSSKDLRVTQIANYNTQLIDKHDRQVAVNEQIITYVVGGHIRAILRNSVVRTLLRGHESAVADIEFLSSEESRIESSSGDNVSILGSVGDDGSVYIWKINRNDNGPENTLSVADAMLLEHPDAELGGRYRRIAFRPGPHSIIAEKGMGVALVLLDGESTDLRMVELVKMNEKMMVRDKFLRSKNEFEDGGEKAKGSLDAAAWLSEKVVVTSRGGHVFLWNADNTISSCIAKLPREKATRVTGIHALDQETLVLVIDSGRELEVWVASSAAEMTSTTLQLQQKIRLFSEKTSDVHCVTSLDPAEELLICSNVRGRSFITLHYNSTAKAFDAVTEIPVMQPIYSFSATRNNQQTNTLDSADHSEENDTKELGLWCVQSRGVQLVHLPRADCRPKVDVKPELYPKPVSKTIHRKTEKIPANLLAQTLKANSSTSKQSKENETTSAQSSSSNVVTATSRKTGPSPPSGSTKVSTTSPPPTSAQTNANTRSTKETTTIKPANKNSSTTGVRESNEKITESKNSSVAPSQTVNNVSKPTPMSTVTPSTAPDPPPNADEAVEEILKAAKETIIAFENKASTRSANEKAKMDRLIESVKDTAATNLERFVNATMKKVLADTLVPGVSQLIADSQVAITERNKIDASVKQEHFEHVLEETTINKSFTNACHEMTQQVSSAVKESMSSKYESVIAPNIEVVNEAAADLEKSVALLKDEVLNTKTEKKQVEVADDAKPEDIRQTIDAQLDRGDVDGAFVTALDKEDLNIVIWLCQKFDCSNFFETHTLSQVTLLSLAQQLGHGIADGEVELKVDWLRELMLVLEPDSDEIDTISQQAVRELTASVDELRKNKVVLDEYDGLEKKLKTLGRLIASHVPK